MKTTLDIDDSLLAVAKAFAARRRTTLTQLVEDGLHLRLRAEQAKPRVVRLPVYRGRGGLRPGVDGRSNASMLSAVEDDDS